MDTSNWEDPTDTDDDSDFFELYEYNDPAEITKECPQCKGTGIARDVEADCLTCYGEGYL
jgi:hypothetical protein